MTFAVSGDVLRALHGPLLAAARAASRRLRRDRAGRRASLDVGCGHRCADGGARRPVGAAAVAAAEPSAPFVDGAAERASPALDVRMAPAESLPWADGELRRRAVAARRQLHGGRERRRARDAARRRRRRGGRGLHVGVRRRHAHARARSGTPPSRSTRRRRTRARVMRFQGAARARRALARDGSARRGDGAARRRGSSTRASTTSGFRSRAAPGPAARTASSLEADAARASCATSASAASASRAGSFTLAARAWAVRGAV